MSDHDPALVEKAAQALMRTLYTMPTGTYGRPAAEFEARAVLDAVAADLTRQAVEQALAPIEALVDEEIGLALMDDDTPPQWVERVRAAVKQARGGAS